MTSLRAGIRLSGKHGLHYIPVEQTCGRNVNVWTGKTWDLLLTDFPLWTSSLTHNRNRQNPKTVTLKTARSDLFQKEIEILKLVRNHPSFRQLLDVVDDPKVLVLDHLSNNLHDVASSRPRGILERWEVKSVAKSVLQGLDYLHRRGLAHTGVFNCI